MGAQRVEERLRGREFELARLALFQRADDLFAMVELAGQSFYASEVLFSVDYAVYCEVGARLCAGSLRAEKERIL
jgi:hypothetical protein